jgi:peptidyl-prolyl cis-trans isomerase A (cyclophilin A)
MRLPLFLSLVFGLAQAAGVSAQTEPAPRVLLDTDRGPVLLELDAVNTPRTTANFLAYVDDGSYNNSLVHRVVRNFVVQAGARRGDYVSAISVLGRPTVPSELRPAPSNLRGTLAMALRSSGGQVDRNSATSSFFINTVNNANLDTDFTVFGRVVFGMGAVDRISAEPVLGEEPVRFPLIKRAVRTSGFPILPLHTGSWYDPAKSRRGFNIEVSQDATDANRLLLVVYWYDYHQGQQVWMNGVAPITLGASSATVPLQITEGGQFGAAYDPQQVQTDTQWGQLQVRFIACDQVELNYSSKFGDGSFSLRRLTSPVGVNCSEG